MSQGKLGNETKELLERFLAISIKNEGPDGINTAAANANLCFFFISWQIYSKQLKQEKSTYIYVKQGSCANLYQDTGLITPEQLKIHYFYPVFHLNCQKRE
jgi:hypothetical protein